ncbi:MAG: hypothetical protein M1156_00795 [Candidatus Marsarchaeota archaeon]|jgi:uncharacterized membrane protein|nr:hypothetical protein [Candidatus Marsarchaeota archaeon]
MAAQKKEDSRPEQHTQSEDKIMFIIAYLVPILTGIVVYILYAEKDKRLRFHAVQAILYGIAFLVIYAILSLILSFFAVFIVALILLDLFALLAWLYGLYIGYEAYMGRQALIPVISDYAQKA